MSNVYKRGPVEIRNATILLGDVRASLRTLPAGSVHCCVTSPPYWGLRAYGTEPQIWGGDPACGHEWIDATVIDSRKNDDTAGPKQRSNPGSVGDRVVRAADRCLKCSAWRGELGSEPTIEQFVSNIVDVFREVKRVLRDDGLCWVNLGDSYAGSWGNQGRKESRGTQREINGGMIQEVGDGRYQSRGSHTGTPPIGLKPKDLCGIPWRVVLALQADGWFWRDTIVWQRPTTEAAMTCQFCGYEFPDECGKYGCPNCEGDRTMSERVSDDLLAGYVSITPGSDLSAIARELQQFRKLASAGYVQHKWGCGAVNGSRTPMWCRSCNQEPNGVYSVYMDDQKCGRCGDNLFSGLARTDCTCGLADFDGLLKEGGA